MELKLRCHCGQKFKFDVEPQEGRMPFAVTCPICGTDGTDAANTVLDQFFPRSAAAPVAMNAAAPVALAVAPAAVARPASLRVTSVPASPPPVVSDNDPPRFIQKTVLAAEKPLGQGNMLLGILGAFLGAAFGVGIVIGLAVLMGFGMSLLCILIGLLSGVGARLMYRGSDSTLGFFAAGITLVATAITLFLMFGFGAILSIMALFISVSTAWKIGSG
jgi:hypothetical protein